MRRVQRLRLVSFGSMSAIPSKADAQGDKRKVRYVPGTDLHRLRHVLGHARRLAHGDRLGRLRVADYDSLLVNGMSPPLDQWVGRTLRRVCCKLAVRAS